MERSSGAIRTACDMQIEGRRGANLEETDGENAVSGSSGQLTLKKGAPTDQV